MADNENKTAPEPEQPEEQQAEEEQQQADEEMEAAAREPEPAAETPPTDENVPEDVARDIDSLATQAREDRKAAERSRTTSIVVFIVLIAVLVGYLSWLYKEVDDMLNPTSLVNLVVVEGTEFLAQSMDIEQEGDWNELAATVFERQVVNYRDQVLRELPNQEEEIAEYLRTGISQGAEYGVQVLTDEVMPELRRTSMDRIEGEMDRVIERTEGRVGVAVEELLEQHKDDLETLADEEAVKEALATILDERLGDLMDRSMAEIGTTMEESAGTLSALAQKMEQRPEELTKKERLRILLLQISHHWFSQIEDEDISRLTVE